MTTTPNPTAEQLVEHALREADMPWLAETPGDIVAAFRAAGLLVGDPTEEQVERAARALYDTEPIRYTLSIHHEKVGESKPWDELNEATKGVYRRRVIKVLAAAGVSPQAHAKDLPTSPGRMKNEADSFNVAPQEASDPNHCQECGAWGTVETHLSGCSKKPAPSTDREKLIAEAEALISARGEGRQDSRLIRGLLDALAAQSVLDESKVAAVIWERAIQKTSKGFSIFNREGAHKIARALCEAAKRGELT